MNVIRHWPYNKSSSLAPSTITNRRKALNYMNLHSHKTGLRHRSVRALLTHTAPTSSQRWKQWINCSYFATFPNLSKYENKLSMLWVTAISHWKRFLSVSPLRSTPSALSANPVCSGASSLLWDCLTSNGSSSKASSFDFPLMCRTNCVPPNHWISRVPHKRHHHMHKVYDCEAPTKHEHCRLWHSFIGCIAFPFTQQGQHA